MRIATILSAALVVLGCSDDAPKQSSKEARAERIARAEAKVSITPVPRTYSINGNQLLVLDVPVLDRPGHLELQRCFVWRDTEMKAATISCPQPAEIILNSQ